MYTEKNIQDLIAESNYNINNRKLSFSRFFSLLQIFISIEGIFDFFQYHYLLLRFPPFQSYFTFGFRQRGKIERQLKQNWNWHYLYIKKKYIRKQQPILWSIFEARDSERLYLNRLVKLTLWDIFGQIRHAWFWWH